MQVGANEWGHLTQPENTLTCGPGCCAATTSEDEATQPCSQALISRCLRDQWRRIGSAWQTHNKLLSVCNSVPCHISGSTISFRQGGGGLGSTKQPTTSPPDEATSEQGNAQAHGSTCVAAKFSSTAILLPESMTHVESVAGCVTCFCELLYARALL
jgi:hypothetical protein